MKTNLSRLFLMAAAIITLCVAMTTTASASEKVLHTFVSGKDGASQQYGVISDSAGNLYGSSSLGGATNNGVIFRLTPTGTGSWQETMIYHFTGGKDGANPGPLAIDAAGNLYGVAQGAGRPTHGTPVCIASGCGTIFRLSPGGPSGWTFNVLHAFTGVNDGSIPQSITLDSKGDIFVTTLAALHAGGAVFEMSPSASGLNGKTIHVFPANSTTDGNEPRGPVIVDAAGNLFGTTEFGGAHFDGTIYELTPGTGGAYTESLIYSFTGGNDGGEPWGALTFDSSGNLVGVATGGGVNRGGVVFMLTPGSGTWNESVLYSFSGGSDGSTPVARPIFDAAGNLYGIAENGGINGPTCSGGCGVVYKLAPSSGGWTKSTLYSFTGANDGGDPSFSGVTLDSSGNLFGTTFYGGKVETGCPNGCGVVFEITAAAATMN
jgi:uncharacterized repeat protein (TIGR03803 family)